MKLLENFAEGEFDALYAKHKRDIGKLKEQQQQHFQRLRLATSIPQTIQWVLPKPSTSAVPQTPPIMTSTFSLRRTASLRRTLEPGNRGW